MFPMDIEPILELIKNSNWLITNFKLKDEGIFNPANYLCQSTLGNKKYQLLIDLNIFSYIVDSLKSQNIRDENRISIALVIFCQLSDIVIDPQIAIYERINYSKKNVERAIEELELFRSIDNTEPEELYNFATGNSNTINRSHYTLNGKSELRIKLLEHTRLTEWNALYLYILKIVQIRLSYSNHIKRIEAVYEWMHKEYRFSSAALVFAFYMLSGNPPSKMNKYNSSKSTEEKKADLYNMVWDLYSINKFYRHWQQNTDYELLVATNDKALAKCFRTLIDLNSSGDRNLILDYFPADYGKRIIKEIESKRVSNLRIYATPEFGEQYQQKLIDELERELLI